MPRNHSSSSKWKVGANDLVLNFSEKNSRINFEVEASKLEDEKKNLHFRVRLNFWRKCPKT